MKKMQKGYSWGPLKYKYLRVSMKYIINNYTHNPTQAINFSLVSTHIKSPNSPSKPRGLLCPRPRHVARVEHHGHGGRPGVGTIVIIATTTSVRNHVRVAGG